MRFKAITLLLLISCGRPGDSITDSTRTNHSCTINDSILSCSDGTVYVLPKQAQDGKAGNSCTVSGQSVICTDGTRYDFPVPAAPKDGVDGSSCSVANGIVTCTDGSYYVIPTPRDGVAGPKGDTGATGAQGPIGRDSIVRIIDPCGASGSGVDELIFVLSTGQLVAWYQNIGLVALKDGTYRTTDTQSCIFKVVNGEYVGS